MLKKSIKGFSQYFTDGTRVFSRHGFHLPESLGGGYKLSADGSNGLELTEVSKEYALSGGESREHKVKRKRSSKKS